MIRHISGPVTVQALGSPSKAIEEFVGLVSTGTSVVSVARMKSPAGWGEPGQTPEFDEYTMVLRGLLRVDTLAGPIEVRAGEAVIAEKGDWVRYSSPSEGGAEYISVCVPAFSPETAHRDES